MSLTDFRNDFLSEVEARLADVNVATATTNELLVSGALYKMAAAVVDADLLSATALRLLEVMSGAELDAWLGDINNYMLFAAICADAPASSAIARSAAAMAAIASSTLAPSMFFSTAANLNAVINSGVALGAIVAVPAAVAAFKGATALTIANIPTMTSNSAPSGTASASSGGTVGTEAWRAFDKITTAGNGWQSPGGQNTNQWLRYDFTAAVFIHTLSINNTPAGVNHSVKDCRLEYSDNGSSWSSGFTFTLPPTTADYTFDIAIAGRHRYWRLFMLNNYSTSQMGICEMQLTGFN